MGFLTYFKECLKVVKQLNLELEKAMATAADFRAVLAEISTEIDRIITVVEDSSNITGGEENELLTSLKGVKDSLAKVGASTPPVDPNNPVDPFASGKAFADKNKD